MRSRDGAHDQEIASMSPDHETEVGSGNETTGTVATPMFNSRTCLNNYPG